MTTDEIVDKWADQEGMAAFGFGKDCHKILQLKYMLKEGLKDERKDV